ncbi:hypothetical protein [Paracoccus thiocyanatus]|uniref:hypothetical protein n=1 Tax=Paracoccus thiocyanatus TaxID=34006 RepID=UPI0015F27C2A|nr:hypothetical protein [Paracoccus thiocyanatus]
MTTQDKTGGRLLLEPEMNVDWQAGTRRAPAAKPTGTGPTIERRRAHPGRACRRRA